MSCFLSAVAAGLVAVVYISFDFNAPDMFADLGISMKEYAAPLCRGIPLKRGYVRYEFLSAIQPGALP
jgi:hypothetical protein